VAQPGNLAELAEFLGFAPQHLFGIVARVADCYTTAKIPKNSDPTQFRELDIPNADLKGIQREILKRALSDVRLHSGVYSYVKGVSLVDAARRLCGNKAILRIDIKDFFPSIASHRIYGLYRSLGFGPSAASILTRLTTYDSTLPQGAPTSPTLSNIVMRHADYSLSKLAATLGLEYTRYSDDLFFAHRKNFAPEEVTGKVQSILNFNGFDLNPQKTRYYPRGVPRKTLGLLTHGEAPAIPGPVRRRIRNEFFRGSRQIGWGQDNLHYLQGMLEWYKLVYGKDRRFEDYESVVSTIRRLKVHRTYQSS
jgi:hypothetical protein